MGLKRKVLAKAEKLTDVPLSTVCGAPVVQLDGYNRVTVENHLGIVEYEQDHIDVSCRNSVLHVVGQALEIRSMNTTTLVITGNIFSVEHKFTEGAQ